MGTVFQHELGAQAEDLLHHQAQFLDDRTFGARLDGTQGIGSSGHGRVLW